MDQDGEAIKEWNPRRGPSLPPPTQEAVGGGGEHSALFPPFCGGGDILYMSKMLMNLSEYVSFFLLCLRYKFAV